MSVSYPPFYDQIHFDLQGNLAVDGSINAFYRNSSIPAPLYSEDGTEIGSVLAIGSDGRTTQPYLLGEFIYRIKIFDSNGALIKDYDEIQGGGGGGGVISEPSSAFSYVFAGLVETADPTSIAVSSGEFIKWQPTGAPSADYLIFNPSNGAGQPMSEYFEELTKSSVLNAFGINDQTLSVVVSSTSLFTSGAGNGNYLVYFSSKLLDELGDVGPLLTSLTFDFRDLNTDTFFPADESAGTRVAQVNNGGGTFKAGEGLRYDVAGTMPNGESVWSLDYRNIIAGTTYVANVEELVQAMGFSWTGAVVYDSYSSFVDGPVNVVAANAAAAYKVCTVRENAQILFQGNDVQFSGVPHRYDGLVKFNLSNDLILNTDVYIKELDGNGFNITGTGTLYVEKFHDNSTFPNGITGNIVNQAWTQQPAVSSDADNGLTYGTDGFLKAVPTTVPGSDGEVLLSDGAGGIEATNLIAVDRVNGRVTTDGYTSINDFTVIQTEAEYLFAIATSDDTIYFPKDFYLYDEVANITTISKQDFKGRPIHLVGAPGGRHFLTGDVYCDMIVDVDSQILTFSNPLRVRKLILNANLSVGIGNNKFIYEELVDNGFTLNSLGNFAPVQEYWNNTYSAPANGMTYVNNWTELVAALSSSDLNDIFCNNEIFTDTATITLGNSSTKRVHGASISSSNGKTVTINQGSVFFYNTDFQLLADIFNGDAAIYVRNASSTGGTYTGTGSFTYEKLLGGIPGGTQEYWDNTFDNGPLGDALEFTLYNNRASVSGDQMLDVVGLTELTQARPYMVVNDGILIGFKVMLDKASINTTGDSVTVSLHRIDGNDGNGIVSPISVGDLTAGNEVGSVTITGLSGFLYSVYSSTALLSEPLDGDGLYVGKVTSTGGVTTLEGVFMYAYYQV